MQAMTNLVQQYCVVTHNTECESHWKCHRLTLPQLIREIHTYAHRTHTCAHRFRISTATTLERFNDLLNFS